MNRRAFLRNTGIATVLVVGGGVFVAYHDGVFSIGQGPAYQPWKDWRDAKDGPLSLVRAAMLAASPHNSQPWLFKVGNSEIELYADTARNTAGLDPYLREMHIGLGCALENMLLAAPASGYKSTATLIPGKLELTPTDPQPVLVARVNLEPASREESALYNAIPRRHTNRYPYDPHRPVPQDLIDALKGLPADDPEVKIFTFTSEADRTKIAHAIAAANDPLYADPDVERGSNRFIRAKWSEVQQYRDGLTIDALGLPPTAAAIAKMIPLWLLSRLASRGGDVYLELLLTAPMFGMIAVRDRYAREQCLSAGRVWQRAHLLATTRGVAARPCNEVVETVDHERKLGRPAHAAEVLEGMQGEGNHEWQPTFMFYMGYASHEAHASPRRPVEELLLVPAEGLAPRI